MSQGAGGLRRSTALQLSIRTASIALLLTSTGRELVETERRHIRRPVEAAQTPKLGGYQTVDDGRGVRPRGFMLAIVRIAPAEVVRLAMAAPFGCARAAEPAHEFRDAIWQQAKEKGSPKDGIASSSTEGLMCGAPSPSTFARLGMNGRCNSFPGYLVRLIDQDRAGILERRAQMPRVVTEAMYNLMKSCAGTAAAPFMVALALVPASGAFAGQTDDSAARLAVLEKENAAIRKENAALRENKVLRQRNASLKSAAPAPQPSASVSAAPATHAKPSVFEAMAADLPVAYKAPPPESPGQFRIWAEGGAIWSGGDPVSQDFNLIDFTGFGGLGVFGGGIGGGTGTIPRHYGLTPKVGWEAAAGFDYRIAGSPWHVSGQFRYGEGGKTGGSASTSGTVHPALLA